jgi:hypothetical protein
MKHRIFMALGNGKPKRDELFKHSEEMKKLVGERGQAGAARKLGVSRQCVHGYLAKLTRVRGLSKRSVQNEKNKPQAMIMHAHRHYLSCFARRATQES